MYKHHTVVSHTDPGEGDLSIALSIFFLTQILQDCIATCISRSLHYIIILVIFTIAKTFSSDTPFRLYFAPNRSFGRGLKKRSGELEVYILNSFITTVAGSATEAAGFICTQRHSDK